MEILGFLLSTGAVLALVWLMSFIVEALRPAPRAPDAMPWDSRLRPGYVTVSGSRLRYLKTGQGPTLVLLHTLRTQLDLFHKVIPALANEFTVYAPDLPGHGHSGIPDGKYDADFFANHVAGFLDELDLRDVTLAGVSIGAGIALILAARRNARIARVVAINPYDYDRGKGMARASPVARLYVFLADIPFIGETVTRLRNYFVMKAIMAGGVSDPASISPQLMMAMYRVGNRAGHYRAFLKLLRNSASWQRAREAYSQIEVPCLMVWGGQDWALPDERRHDESLVPAARSITIAGGGHFLPLDVPAEVIRHIADFARAAKLP